jgi:hypothetical protein
MGLTQAKSARKTAMHMQLALKQLQIATREQESSTEFQMRQTLTYVLY